MEGFFNHKQPAAALQPSGSPPLCLSTSLIPTSLTVNIIDEIFLKLSETYLTD